MNEVQLKAAKENRVPWGLMTDEEKGPLLEMQKCMDLIFCDPCDAKGQWNPKLMEQ